MFQLMIVDDEPTAVNSMAASLPWSELGIDEVICAYSAKEALRYAEMRSIDIVISDIRMPGMDGIELVRHLRELSPRTVCLLLTGYAEFEYAKQAVQLQMADYLLKPVSDEKLMDSLRGVIERLRREWEQIASYQRALQTLREHMPALTSNLLGEWLTKGAPDREACDDKLELLHLPYRYGDCFELLMLRVESDESNYGDSSLLDYAIMNIAEELFRQQFHLLSYKDSHRILVAAAIARTGELSSPAARSSVVNRLAPQLQAQVRNLLKSELSIVIGAGGRFPDDLRTAYREALAAMRRTAREHEGLLMQAGERREPPAIGTLNGLHEPPSLLHLFEAGAWEEALQKLKKVFEELAAAGRPAPDHIAECYHTITAAGYHYAHLNGKPFANLFDDGGRSPFDANGLLSLPRLQEWAFSLCNRLLRENRKEIQDMRSSTIKDVMDYIHAHLEEDVSLQTLADRVHWHPVSLSKIFKLSTGEGLSDYLFRVRMERAIQLLQHSDLKIYEITAKIGYLNTPHFIKVFKRTFGVTPQEFREQAGEQLYDMNQLGWRLQR